MPARGSDETKAYNKTAIITGTVAAGVIVLVGVILILAQFESRLSPAVLGLAILSTTIAVLLGVSTVVYRLVYGALAELPASVPEEKGERRAVRRAALLCLSGWLILLAIAFMVGAGATGAIAGA